MASYRLYCGTSGVAGGHAEVLDAANDSEALALARAIAKGAVKWQVWEGQRLVATMANTQAHQLTDA